MRAHFGLPSVVNEDQEGRPPISIKFEIPYFTVSGIQVRCLLLFNLLIFLFTNSVMQFKFILSNPISSSLKTFSAVFFAHPNVQVFCSLKPQELWVRLEA